MLILLILNSYLSLLLRIVEALVISDSTSQKLSFSKSIKTYID